MGRTRLIKSEFFRSRSLGRVDIAARLTYIGLWSEADDAGRGIDDPRVLKGALWPLDDDISVDDVSGHLDSLERTGHINRYAVGDDHYYAVVRWEQHQAAAYRRGNPKYPPPSPDGLHDLARETVLSSKLEGKGSKAAAAAVTDDSSPTTAAAAAALKLYIDHRTRTGVMRNETGYRRKLAQVLPAEHADELRMFLDVHPEADRDMIARGVYRMSNTDIRRTDKARQ